jgi:hypothetical protein
MRTTRLQLLRRRYGIDAGPDTNFERIWMMIESIARVPTAKGSRYLQQLCKHWSHDLNVAFTAEAGTVVFPRNARGADWPGDAKLTLQAHEDSLECRLEASADDQLEALKGVVARHLDRFAFREAPLQFDWR